MKQCYKSTVPGKCLGFKNPNEVFCGNKPTVALAPLIRVFLLWKNAEEESATARRAKAMTKTEIPTTGTAVFAFAELCSFKPSG